MAQHGGSAGGTQTLPWVTLPSAGAARFSCAGSIKAATARSSGG